MPYSFSSFSQLLCGFVLLAWPVGAAQSAVQADVQEVFRGDSDLRTIEVSVNGTEVTLAARGESPRMVKKLMRPPGSRT